jgi:hypothetical protein
MTETGSLGVAERADVIVRELRESDLPLADVILRSAFDRFTGVASLFGDRDYVRTRWLADPGAAFAAVDHHADHLELGINAGCHEAYAAVMARGYRAGLVGVTMHRANDEGYSRPGTWLIDDWRRSEITRPEQKPMRGERS